ARLGGHARVPLGPAVAGRAPRQPRTGPVAPPAPAALPPGGARRPDRLGARPPAEPRTAGRAGRRRASAPRSGGARHRPGPVVSANLARHLHRARMAARSLLPPRRTALRRVDSQRPPATTAFRQAAATAIV